MKRITGFVLLMAGILLSLTGCQKGNEIDKSGNAVRFGVSTGVNTRTAYSGETYTNNNLSYERIDWIEGEEIMIWSDQAVIDADATPKFEGNQNLAVYKIGSVTGSNEKSYATINDPLGNGLQYKDKTSEHKFWGFYPASAVKESPADNSVSLKIDAAQTLTANAHTEDITNDYVPSMDQAYMVAYKGGATASDATVDLEFNPAFTAFEFVIKSNKTDNLTIKSVELVSETSALSGEFTATCSNGTWAYTMGAADKISKSVKATLPNGGLTINNQNSLILDIFALPQELTGLKVIFDTVEEGTKALKLTSTAGGTDYISFAPCKKHVINGLILPGGWYFSLITLDLKVLNWEAVDIDGESGEFPQATQFNVSGEGVKNGYKDIHGEQGDKDPWRQRWYFQPNQTVTVYFRVMLPAGGTWEVEIVGGEEDNPVPADAALFKVKNVSPAIDDETPTVATNLYGPMHQTGSTEVELEITYIGTDTAPHSCYFHTYVYSGANKTGTKYNIDSETQIYDRGRGYHTFYVNNELYN